MALTVGTRIGVYEITGRLGAGGMGEVYRAHDTTLGRDVAIKVLPDSMADDPERLARFQREAEVLATLNHPNIAAIYGLEETDDSKALVMELVEGDDLSLRIAHGAMPIEDVLPIARQIAEALEAAHEQGIIHRDLKPANIKVRVDGTVKVLDFGLAKAMDPVDPTVGRGFSRADAANSPTMTTPAMTEMGMILGTAAYMAPEQAKGKAVDKRADIWAFGAVLYEMLTGQRAFAGSDVSEMLASVLAREPDWTLLPAGLSPVLETYLRRCLQKDPKQRIHDIGDVRLALEGAFDTTAAPPTVAPAALRIWQRPVPGRCDCAAPDGDRDHWHIDVDTGAATRAGRQIRVAIRGRAGAVRQDAIHGRRLCAGVRRPDESGQGRQLWIRRWRIWKPHRFGARRAQSPSPCRPTAERRRFRIFLGRCEWSRLRVGCPHCG